MRGGLRRRGVAPMRWRGRRRGGAARTNVVALVDDEAAQPVPAGRLLREHSARQAGAHDDQVVVVRKALQSGHLCATRGVVSWGQVSEAAVRRPLARDSATAAALGHAPRDRQLRGPSYGARCGDGRGRDGILAQGPTPVPMMKGGTTTGGSELRSANGRLEESDALPATTQRQRAKSMHVPC